MSLTNSSQGRANVALCMVQFGEIRPPTFNSPAGNTRVFKCSWSLSPIAAAFAHEGEIRDSKVVTRFDPSFSA